MTQEELGAALGVSKQAVSQWESGTSDPGRQKIRKIAQVLSVSKEWLDLGGGVLKPPPAENYGIFAEQIELSIYTDVRAGDADGCVEYDEDSRRTMEMPRDFLAQLVKFIPPKEVGVMFMKGDSMEPTLEAGDMVIYDRQTEIADAGLYVILLDKHLIARRVHLIPGGGYILISDNKYAGYPDDRLVYNEAEDLSNAETSRPVDFRPVGRVLWPKRSTDRVHVKQVGEIIRSVIRNGTEPSFGRPS